MNLALSGMLWSECLVYLDDIIIFGQIFEEHLSHLASELREVNLKAKLSKCNFVQEQVLYLGHIISPEGIATEPSKTQTGLPGITYLQSLQNPSRDYVNYTCRFEEATGR